MKKLLTILSVMMLAVVSLAGCSTDSNELEELVVYFVPSRNPEDIEKATEPLQDMLKEELAAQGFEFENISVEVGTSYEAVGESLAAGTAHVGFVPGGTYAIFADDIDVALTATRYGLNHDSENPADWNTAPTENTTEPVTYYRTLVIAGPTEKGQELAAKINNGEALTKEDIESATWGVQSSTSSSAGYVYPTLWLQENYGISITDLPNKVALDGYATAISQLANGQIDVMVAYADARLDYVDIWTTDLGREATIWEETNVIGVTEGIYNDTISVTKDEVMTPELKEAIQQAFINIGNSEAGQEIISIYSHKGYQVGSNEDYEGAKKAQEIIQAQQQ
ncbi:MAG TPA: phosphonate ABC transporter substrate-binding protein [Firmicutes bacterium]|nr:phosphonate ABC transporter substrate-binding protein [Bacillota bacterium]